MRRALGWLASTLVLLACVGYQFLVHSALSNDAYPEIVRFVLVVTPLVALGCWIVMRSRNKSLGMAALLAATLMAYLLEHSERLGMAAISGTTHAAINLLLLWVFARTLRPGQEPLVTRLARSVHGMLTPKIEIYTRRVTIMWSLFFALQLIVSALLLYFASLSVWSLFINILNLPLVALMFVCEYVYRVTRHRDHPRASIATAIRAFAKDASPSKSAEAR